jgi:photosystem II stability/assembly factor-like uncharacterized protein
MKQTIFIIFCLFWIFYGCRKDRFSVAEWREVPLPVSDDMNSIWFRDSLHGVVAGGTIWKRGVICSTTDGGQHWQLDTILRNPMEHVSFYPWGTGYVCGVDGLGYYSAAEWGRWILFRNDWFWMRDLHALSPTRCVIIGGEAWGSGQIRTFSVRDWWMQDSVWQYQSALNGLAFSDATTAHAVGMGWVLRSDDAGQTWQRLRVDGDFFKSVTFPTTRTGYICGFSGTLLKTTDGGQHWDVLRKGGVAGTRHQPFTKIFFVSENEGFLVGENSIFWHTTNGGERWQQVEQVPDNVDFTDVFANQNGVWATAKGGRLFFLKL